MSEHRERRCHGCGQVDDHPHIILADWTGHHDCLPSAAVLALTRDADTDPVAEARNFAITKALEGVHGDELRAAIAEHHDKRTAPALRKLHREQAAAATTITIGG